MDWNQFFGSHGFTLFLSSSDYYASIAAALSLLCESECRCHSQSLLNFYPLPNPSKSSDSTTICSICICFPNLNQTRFKKQVITFECSRGSSSEKCDVSKDVATELELKTPGSAIQQDLLSGERKGKQPQRKERTFADGCCSSRFSSSQGFQDSSSNSVGDAPKLDKCTTD